MTWPTLEDNTKTAGSTSPLVALEKEANLGKLEEKCQEQKYYEIYQVNHAVVQVTKWDVVKYKNL